MAGLSSSRAIPARRNLFPLFEIVEQDRRYYSTISSFRRWHIASVSAEMGNVPQIEELPMPKVLVSIIRLTATSKKMAEAVAEGRAAPAPRSTVKRVPELFRKRLPRALTSKLGQAAPIATGGRTRTLRCYIVGTGTASVAMFPNGSLPRSGRRLVGEGGVARQGRRCLRIGVPPNIAAQEMTLFSIITNLLHFGMTIVGLPYSHQGQMSIEEIVGVLPRWTTVAGGGGSRQPTRSTWQ